MSWTVTRPLRRNSSSTTSTRSRRCWCMSAIASWRLAPSRTVTSFFCGVMMAFTGASSSVSKRRSRLVTMPTTLLPFTTGKPEILCSRCSAITSRTGSSGGIVIGSRSTPDSKRFTFCTAAACAVGLMLLWMMPIPPSCARAIARRASVTVSMAADTIGRFSCSFRVRRVLRETSRGRTREGAGRRRTSSKVSAFWITRMFSARKAALYAILSSIQTLKRWARDMKRIVLLTALAVFAAAASAQQYKWVDQDGKVRYGDVPPPGVKAQRLKPPSGGYAAPAPSTAAPAGKKDEKKLTPEQAFQKRQKDAQESDAKADKERQEAELKRANCSQAQDRLRSIQSGQRVARTNAAGEQVYLEDNEIAQERARAEKLVSEWCK